MKIETLLTLLTKENKTKSYFSWLVFNIVNRRINREIPSVKSPVKFNFSTTHAQGCRLERFVVGLYRVRWYVLKLCQRKEDVWESQLSLQKTTSNIWRTL